MKQRVLSLGLALIGALALPAEAQKYPSHTKGGIGKAHYASPAKQIGGKHFGTSHAVSVKKKHFGFGASTCPTPGFGVSFSKPGFSISVGSGGHGHLSVHKPCAPKPVWVPGHWTTVRERVWIPASYEQVWIEPVFATKYDECGNPYQVMVEAGHYDTVCTPGHYDVQIVNQWVDGYWKYA